MAINKIITSGGTPIYVYYSISNSCDGITVSFDVPSSATSWLNATTGTSGTSKYVKLSASTNNGSSRSATVETKVNGITCDSKSFFVTQDGSSCDCDDFSITTSSIDFPSSP